MQCNSVCPLCANSGLMQRSKKDRYSIPLPVRRSCNVNSDVSDVEVVRALASSGIDLGGNLIDAFTVDIEGT